MDETRLIRIGGVFGEMFGYPVVEVHGPFADDFTSLKWAFTDHRDGEVAKFAVGGFRVRVVDQDGDCSVWGIRRHGKVVASGEEDGFDPPHFFAALAKAEAALRALVRDAKAALLEAQTQKKRPSDRR
jgi:hypothetical protein